MSLKNILILVVVALVLVGGGYYLFGRTAPVVSTPEPAVQTVIISGSYVCLPHLDTTGLQTKECVFGLKVDDSTFYAVNFGASASAMSQFESGRYITAEGFVTPKEALSDSQWAKYNMKGIFTVTKMISSTTPSAGAEGKLNINVVCEGALAYMTFPSSVEADTFVAECKEGKHPEVIEQYKKQMGLGEGAAI